MIPAASSYPAERGAVQLLVVDPHAGQALALRFDELPSLLCPGDLIVLNDAATLPASLYGVDGEGRPLELRLMAAISDNVFRGVLFGPGSWREKTERRRAPPELTPGARLVFGALTATVKAVSDRSRRLCDVEFHAAKADLVAELYRVARPVQYSHLAHELPLWAVQNVYAERPWAFEMPSAGRPLTWETLFALRRRGVGWARLTHAAGLSATSDPAIDASLPLAERFDVPEATVAAIERAQRGGGRVIAVGTSVVRALEAAALSGRLEPGSGVTELHIDGRHVPRVVDGVLSGVHQPGESHHTLLAAFADPALLDRALTLAAARSFRSHELGDSMLLLPGVLAGRSRARRDESGVVGDGRVVQDSAAVGRAHLAPARVGTRNSGL